MPRGLILPVKNHVCVMLLFKISKYFLHFKVQEFLMFSNSSDFGDDIFVQWHLTFTHSISIKFSPDRLGVLSSTEISMLRQLNKLTNCGTCLTDFGCRGIAQCLQF